MAGEVVCSLPFVYDSPGEARDTIREVSNTASHTVAEVSRGNQFGSAQADRASIDRANQDRFLAGEFSRSQVAVAQMEARLQKDNVDAAQWNGQRHNDLTKQQLESKFDLATAVERNGRSAELATEKIGAANILVIEKTAAATILAIKEAEAKAAKCCCEAELRAERNTATILAAFSAQKLADLERKLTVFEVRQGIPLSVTPVG